MQDRSSIVKALDLGALGFIPKSGQREVMLSAVQLVFAGGIYIPPEILACEDLPLPKPALTKAICRVFELALPTVKNHVTAILKALKVTNRTEAVIAVSELGWELPRVAECRQFW